MSMRWQAKGILVVTLLAAAGVLLTSCLSGCAQAPETEAAAVKGPAQASEKKPLAESKCPALPEVSAEEAAALPWADSSTVIPGLELAPKKIEAWGSVSKVVGEAALLYARDGSDAYRAAGWMSRTVPWSGSEEQPIVVLDKLECGWSKVMTAATGGAPSPEAAGSYVGFMRTADLADGWDVTKPVTVSLSAGTLTMPDGQVFETVLGAAETPTVEAIGYLVGSYVDETQQITAGHPITLTSVHGEQSYGRNQAELGIHFSTLKGGASHGCIRLADSPAHAEAVAELPAGTPIIIEREPQ